VEGEGDCIGCCDSGFSSTCLRISVTFFDLPLGALDCFSDIPIHLSLQLCSCIWIVLEVVLVELLGDDN